MRWNLIICDTDAQKRAIENRVVQKCERFILQCRPVFGLSGRKKEEKKIYSNERDSFFNLKIENQSRNKDLFFFKTTLVKNKDEKNAEYGKLPDDIHDTKYIYNIYKYRYLPRSLVVESQL